MTLFQSPNSDDVGLIIGWKHLMLNATQFLIKDHKEDREKILEVCLGWRTYTVAEQVASVFEPFLEKKKSICQKLVIKILFDTQDVQLSDVVELVNWAQLELIWWFMVQDIDNMSKIWMEIFLFLSRVKHPSKYPLLKHLNAYRIIMRYFTCPATASRLLEIANNISIVKLETDLQKYMEWSPEECRNAINEEMINLHELRVAFHFYAEEDIPKSYDCLKSLMALVANKSTLESMFMKFIIYALHFSIMATENFGNGLHRYHHSIAAIHAAEYVLSVYGTNKNSLQRFTRKEIWQMKGFVTWFKLRHVSHLHEISVGNLENKDRKWDDYCEKEMKIPDPKNGIGNLFKGKPGYGYATRYPETRQELKALEDDEIGLLAELKKYKFYWDPAITERTIRADTMKTLRRHINMLLWPIEEN